MSDSLLKFKESSPDLKTDQPANKGVKGSGFSFSLSSLLPGLRNRKYKVKSKKYQQPAAPSSPPDYKGIATSIVENEEKLERQRGRKLKSASVEVLSSTTREEIQYESPVAPEKSPEETSPVLSQKKSPPVKKERIVTGTPKKSEALPPKVHFIK